MPARIAAVRIGSSRATSKVRSAGRTVTCKLMKILGWGMRPRFKRGGRAPLHFASPIVPAGRRTGATCTPMEPRATRMLRRPRLLIVGCGDVGLRVLRLLGHRWHVLAVTHSPERRAALRAAGATPLLADLDDAATLARLARLADAVLHLAPPTPHGGHDRRTAALLAALGRGGVLRLVYASTSGVYGDCGGERVHETRTPNPSTDRACRRVDAELRVRSYARANGARATILRVPGIYAFDRTGGDPRERVR